MTTQYTPGPWQHGKAFDPAPYHLPNVISVSACGQVLAHVNTAWGGSETEANARLIAAAPDLLASLRDALEYWDTLDVQGHRLTQHEAPAIRARMHAAIAKAEGK